MTQKNPFEIRTEILQLAKNYMDNQYHMNIELVNDMFEQGKLNTADVQEAYEMYSIDELMEKAKKMYAFVSTKD
tara:strand:- start:1970 stop:2191 length:222 start_codon:yes stop_codon:yes gene_type:complete